MHFIDRGTNESKPYNFDDYLGTTNLTARLRGTKQINVDLSKVNYRLTGDILYFQAESWALTPLIYIIFAVLLLISCVTCFYLGPKKNKLTLEMEKPELGRVRYERRSARQRASIADQFMETESSSESESPK